MARRRRERAGGAIRDRVGIGSELRGEVDRPEWSARSLFKSPFDTDLVVRVAVLAPSWDPAAVDLDAPIPIYRVNFSASAFRVLDEGGLPDFGSLVDAHGRRRAATTFPIAQPRLVEGEPADVSLVGRLVVRDRHSQRLRGGRRGRTADHARAVPDEQTQRVGCSAKGSPSRRPPALPAHRTK